MLERLAGGLARHWDKAMFALAVLAVVFAYGVAVGRYHVFPYWVLKAGTTAAIDWKSNWRTYLGLRPGKYLYPAVRDGAGVVRHVEAKTQPGVTLITTVVDDAFIPVLIDPEGHELHRWDVRFSRIWPDPAHLEVPPANDWDAHIHGALLYPNGDIVFNFEGYGLAKVDRCANVVWRVGRETHHSVFEDEAGRLWVPASKHRDRDSGRFPRVELPLIEDYVLEISPEGDVLREISVLEAIYGSRYEGLLFANAQGSVSLEVNEDENDPTHLNDVEVLPAALDARFPLFEAGDILVSLRNLNLLLVMDPRTETVKWAQTGPYLRQHDPDFTPTGRISVFDNRSDDAGGTLFGGSRILEVDPAGGRVSVVYQGDERDPFFTDIRGKHQRLANGNILIAESNRGRAFEVTPDGEVVWSYVSRWDEDEVALVTEAERYPDSYAAFAKEPCP